MFASVAYAMLDGHDVAGCDGAVALNSARMRAQMLARASGSYRAPRGAGRGAGPAPASQGRTPEERVTCARAPRRGRSRHPRPRWTTTRTTPAEGRAERGQNVRVDDRADESRARRPPRATRGSVCSNWTTGTRRRRGESDVVTRVRERVSRTKGNGRTDSKGRSRSRRAVPNEMFPFDPADETFPRISRASVTRQHPRGEEFARIPLPRPDAGARLSWCPASRPRSPRNVCRRGAHRRRPVRPPHQAPTRRQLERWEVLASPGIRRRHLRRALPHHRRGLQAQVS